MKTKKGVVFSDAVGDKVKQKFVKYKNCIFEGFTFTKPFSSAQFESCLFDDCVFESEIVATAFKGCTFVTCDFNRFKCDTVDSARFVDCSFGANVIMPDAEYKSCVFNYGEDPFKVCGRLSCCGFPRPIFWDGHGYFISYGFPVIQLAVGLSRHNGYSVLVDWFLAVAATADKCSEPVPLVDEAFGKLSYAERRRLYTHLKTLDCALKVVKRIDGHDEPVDSAECIAYDTKIVQIEIEATRPPHPRISAVTVVLEETLE